MISISQMGKPRLKYTSSAYHTVEAQRGKARSGSKRAGPS